MSCSRIFTLERLADCLVKGARRELYLTPKPGLVDRHNRGSHPDLSLAKMEASVEIVSGYLSSMARSLQMNEPFDVQKQLAIAAEQRLYDQIGTNTHKGFIFLSGMLLIARWHADSDDESLIRDALSHLAIRFFRTAPLTSSHGQRVREKYDVRGIVGETARGMPSMFEVALPAFRAASIRHGDDETASFAMMARLMQCVEDTTTLHRAGPLGLLRIRKDGKRLETLLAAGGDYRQFLAELDRDYVRMNLTMGGVADMLGMAFGYLMAMGELKNENDPALEIVEPSRLALSA